jgi:hypothetical protein
VNAIVVAFQTEARTSPHWFGTHRQNQGLGGGDSGDSAGSRPKEAPIGLWPEATRVGEGGAPLIPGEPCASFGPRGFECFGIVL